jgi:glycosyltransferase EpsD
MMKKVLFTATVDSHILAFHMPFLKYFKELDYEVHVATNGDAEIPYCDAKHIISFERSPFKLNNLRAIRQLKIIIDAEQYDIIHTHTPMGSVITRLAALRARKSGTRVVYTAHGFHFFKGAPLKNWLIFYPIEKLLAHFTDTLITINKEDYDHAKGNFHTHVEYVPGVGIDVEKFNFKMTKRDKKKLRESLGIKESDFVMIYPAELSKRKRQLWLIGALKDFMTEHTDTHLLLPGKDSLNGKCQKLVKEFNLLDRIHFLGFRNDIPRLLNISDIAVSAASQEGLPVNIMEQCI